MNIAGIDLADGNLPKHIGVIMDGNGRWASSRGLSRQRGHHAGMQALKAFLNLVEKTPVQIVTLFCFSKENWKRPQEELDGLFQLIRQFYRSEFPTLKKRKVRVLHSGDCQGLPEDVALIFETMQEETCGNPGKVLNLAMNYSGRDEMVRAARRLLSSNPSPESVNEESFAALLDHPGIGDIDLVIRTSGELRLSNFCLWQAAYAEMYFTDAYWPAFSERDFAEAILAYQGRERRFGAAAPLRVYGHESEVARA
jgi:undecaprenyl diphosphate synthase